MEETEGREEAKKKKKKQVDGRIRGGFVSGSGSSQAHLIQLRSRITVSISDTNAVLMRRLIMAA